MSARLRVFAPAKINLHLHVGPPRADGRHPLQSLALFADVGDVLEVEPAESLSLQVLGPFAATLASEPDNLVLRAARALAEAAGRPSLGARLLLHKHLPVASGIGGGSADAAAALRGLTHLWGIETREAELERLAGALGADVPVCVRAQAAFMAGAGEITTAVAVPDLWAVLVNPGVPLSTEAVYRRFDDLALGGAFMEEPAPTAVPDLLAYASARRNDLEAPARALSPEVAACLELLASREEAKLARMSGSGSTCFALCHSAEAAQSLAERLGGSRPEWWVRPARLGAVDVAPREAERV